MKKLGMNPQRGASVIEVLIVLVIGAVSTTDEIVSAIEEAVTSGVGLMTRAMLMANTLAAEERRRP